MNALEIAADMESVGVYTDAAAMLRRQHEAIVKLREALEACSEIVGANLFQKYCGQALKDTEDLK